MCSEDSGEGEMTSGWATVILGRGIYLKTTFKDSSQHMETRSEWGDPKENGNSLSNVN